MRNALTPITDELLEDNQLLVLTFPTTGESVEAYSLFIKRSNPIQKDYTEMQSIASGDTVDLNKLGENGHAEQVTVEGSDVYRVDEDIDVFRINHLGQAWRPDDIKIWWENPNGELIQGFTRDIVVTVGDDEGYHLSQHTRYDSRMPSTELETFIIPGITPFIGFENSHPELEQTPTGYFYGRAYDITVINAIDMDKARDVALGREYKRTVKPFGPLDAYRLGIPDEWKDPVTLTQEEYVNAMGGR